MEEGSAPRHETVARAFRRQAHWCWQLGSPFTAGLLARAAVDIEAGGWLAELTARWPGDPAGHADALPSRFASAVHALALAGNAPALTAAYPPFAGPLGGASLWQTVKTAVEAQIDEFKAALASPPQTNEVGRGAIILGGLFTIARQTGLPFRLLELGASAGLLLAADKYRYDLGPSGPWGDVSSSVEIQVQWTGRVPSSRLPLAVARRQGCDMRPIRLDDPTQILRLRSYIWADQAHRIKRLDSAIGVARRLGIDVDAGDAADWLAARLAEPSEDTTRVVFHAFVWQYLPTATRARIAELLDEVGRSSTVRRPLAWLRYEPPAGGGKPVLDVTIWPDGTQRALATGDLHGRSVAWNDG